MRQRFSIGFVCKPLGLEFCLDAGEVFFEGLDTPFQV
jgi:hypothetical protein